MKGTSFKTPPITPVGCNNIQRAQNSGPYKLSCKTDQLRGISRRNIRLWAGVFMAGPQIMHSTTALKALNGH